MKLCKMIEMYLKYDNMHTIRTINAFICINNLVNACIKCMLSIDVKIEPRIALIVENFSDSFFIVISTFKGRFQNIFYTIIYD